MWMCTIFCPFFGTHLGERNSKSAIEHTPAGLLRKSAEHVLRFLAVFWNTSPPHYLNGALQKERKEAAEGRKGSSGGRLSFQADEDT